MKEQKGGEVIKLLEGIDDKLIHVAPYYCLMQLQGLEDKSIDTVPLKWFFR